MSDHETPEDARRNDLLGWIGFTDEPDFRRARPLGALVGVVFSLLFLAALGAAFVTLFGTFRPAAGGNGAGLGTGALIVAILSAPFLIWGTIIKHRALGFQKEGHLTDRISKAVEQLGAEKAVSYIARNVTRHARPPEQREAGESDWVDQLQKLDRESLTHDRIGDEATEYAEWKVFSETVPNIEVRIGGILSLERIAQDSTAYDHGRDHVRVMEILCAYVRENAPASGAKDHEFGEWVPLSDNPNEAAYWLYRARCETRFHDNRFEGAVHRWAQGLPRPREDVALAIRVIGRRTAEQRRVEAAWPKPPSNDTNWIFDLPLPTLPGPNRIPSASDATLTAFHKELDLRNQANYAFSGYRPNLSNTNLQRVDLSGLTLSGAIFSRARLDGADISNARMVGANFYLARIDGAILMHTKMQGAVLENSSLEGAILVHAEMQGANFARARMEGANLSGAKLEGANLYGAHLDYAEIGGARLDGANLCGAHMVETTLIWAWLHHADLSAARLDGSSLSEAWLDGARMNGETSLRRTVLLKARSRQIDLTTVPISAEQIASMFGDASVTLPPGMARPAHWPSWKLDTSDFHDEYRKYLANPAAYTPPPPPVAP